MSEEAKPHATAVEATPADSSPVHASAIPESEPELVTPMNGTAFNGAVETTQSELTEADAPVQGGEQSNPDDKQPSEADAQDKAATNPEELSSDDKTKPDATESAVNESTTASANTSASANKAKARRKSTGVPEHKGRKLNKKASKAKLTQTDAQPGDYFYVRLKGYPLWPAIVCDESMLPSTLLKSRPVTAAGPDGTYRTGYEDDGPKVKDRTFPVMYLHTNEFGWIPNTDLLEIDFAEITNFNPNLRKDLATARLLAAEKNDLDYFKDILKSFMEAKKLELAHKEAAKAEKKVKSATPKKEKEKKSSKTTGEIIDEDLDMPDVDVENENEEGEDSTQKKIRKRPAEENLAGTEQKKPKLKILNTPKATNGSTTPKSVKEKSATKSAKSRPKKTATKIETPEIVVPKEPELTAEEKRLKKEKEILFLRHKLQKGLLTKDQEPKAEDMKQMSEYIAKLEGYSDLEVSIIRATKINKVLKAILKLPSIPKEEDFEFKSRSQTLLDKWNKLLATDTAPSTTNGVASELKNDPEDSKDSPIEATNGTKESSLEDKTGGKPIAASYKETKGGVPETDEELRPSDDQSTESTAAEPLATNSVA